MMMQEGTQNEETKIKINWISKKQKHKQYRILQKKQTNGNHRIIRSAAGYARKQAVQYAAEFDPGMNKRASKDNGYDTQRKKITEGGKRDNIRMK